MDEALDDEASTIVGRRFLPNCNEPCGTGGRESVTVAGADSHGAEDSHARLRHRHPAPAADAHRDRAGRPAQGQRRPPNLEERPK